MALIGVYHPKQKSVALLAAQRLFNSLLNKQSLRSHQNTKLESPCRREGIQFRCKCYHRRTKIWKKGWECCQEKKRVLFAGPGSFCEQSIELVPIDLASLSMPDLVWMSWHEIKTLKMHLSFLDLPASNWLNQSSGELTWKVELKEPIHRSKSVNAIELMTDNTDNLRKVHFFGIPQNPVADELTLDHLIAMEPRSLRSPTQRWVPSKQTGSSQVNSLLISQVWMVSRSVARILAMIERSNFGSCLPFSGPWRSPVQMKPSWTSIAPISLTPSISIVFSWSNFQFDSKRQMVRLFEVKC